MKNCWLVGMLSLLSGMSWAQCATGTPGTNCSGPLSVQPQSGNNAQSAITLVDLGLPVVAPAAGQYTLSIANGMLVESDNGSSYHSLMGLQGPQGPAGPTGPQGTTGATGAAGPVGPQARQELRVRLARRERSARWGRRARLVRQARRERRERRERSAGGPAGATGPTGATGATGTTGAVGPVGPAGAVGPRVRSRWSSGSDRGRRALPVRLDLREPPEECRRWTGGSAECRVRKVHRGQLELRPLRPITASITGPGTKRVWAQLKSGAHPIAIRLT